MKLVATSALALSVAAGGAWAATISTLGAETSSISPWGLPDTAAYGQSFTFGTSVDFASMTFRISSSNAISYDAFLYEMTGADYTDVTTGGVIASTSGATSGSGTMESYTANFGSVILGPGTYAVLFQATSAGSANWGSNGSDATYSGGTFLFQNNGGDSSQLNGGTLGFASFGDLAFEVTYDAIAAVPLPASALLLGIPLAGLGFAGRKRRTA